MAPSAQEAVRGRHCTRRACCTVDPTSVHRATVAERSGKIAYGTSRDCANSARGCANSARGCANRARGRANSGDVAADSESGDAAVEDSD